MSKLLFFLKFYRTQKMRFFVLVIIFAFAGAVLSCSLLVHDNSQVYSQAQIQELRGTQADGEDSPGNFSDVFDIMERVMTVFSLGSILTVVWGCTSILFFRIFPCRNHMPCCKYLVCERKMFLSGLWERVFLLVCSAVYWEMLEGMDCLSICPENYVILKSLFLFFPLKC